MVVLAGVMVDLHMIGSLAVIANPSRQHFETSTSPHCYAVPLRHSFAMTRLRQRIERARDRFWYIEEALEIILYCPCVCMEGLRFCFDPNHRGSDMRPEPEEPIPLGPRVRALTLPLDDATPDQQTLEQPQSMFFAKLPLELRHRVYEYALGGAHIHLKFTARKLHGARSPPSTRKESTRTDDLKCALGLLRTCRIVYVLPRYSRERLLLILCLSYSESIEFLYSANYLIMSNVQREPFVLPHLPKFLVPQRLNSIRHLRLNWSVDRYLYSTTPDLTEWFAAWESLIQLQGLHYLHIRTRNTHLLNDYNAEVEDFYFTGWNVWDSHTTEMFEPVTRMKVLKNFVITLPHAKCSTDFDIGTSNCVFRHPSR
jgi:hypothetical protein